MYSSTKGVTSVCANLMIERGLLDPDATVASVWPEFAAERQGTITVGHVLSHQAGLPYIDRDLTLEDTLAWHPAADALAAQAPIWEPGTTHGYHMRTFGWLVGELVRVAPIRQHRTIGRWFRDEIGEPLGLDFWIGLPEALEPRVARLVPPTTDLREALKAFGDDLLARARVLESRRALQLRRHVEHPRIARRRAAVVERHRQRTRTRAPVRGVHRRGRRRLWRASCATTRCSRRPPSGHAARTRC